jgi:hypothetical protein
MGSTPSKQVVVCSVRTAAVQAANAQPAGLTLYQRLGVSADKIKDKLANPTVSYCEPTEYHVTVDPKSSRALLVGFEFVTPKRSAHAVASEGDKMPHEWAKIITDPVAVVLCVHLVSQASLAADLATNASVLQMLLQEPALAGKPIGIVAVVDGDVKNRGAAAVNDDIQSQLFALPQLKGVPHALIDPAEGGLEWVFAQVEKQQQAAK